MSVCRALAVTGYAQAGTTLVTVQRSYAGLQSTAWLSGSVVYPLLKKMLDAVSLVQYSLLDTGQLASFVAAQVGLAWLVARPDHGLMKSWVDAPMSERKFELNPLIAPPKMIHKVTWMTQPLQPGETLVLIARLRR